MHDFTAIRIFLWGRRRFSCKCELKIINVICKLIEAKRVEIVFERLLKIRDKLWGLEWAGREGWRGPGNESSKQTVGVSLGPHLNCAWFFNSLLSS